ncbi:hypothetical protein GUJ93_ZPchr0010g7625 [Zizania palustris]|uniref:Uncharacterized protein n=1 Tax=Zizania palustris TaxID=103762 RepID=A0A8J6BN68_ZIZPA|nr:hypothetical protein GUJ93_ZPchr0010g7625 [Zizania palustris]
MCLANRRLAAPHRRVPARLRARAGHPLGRAPLRAHARPRACACASPAPRLAPNHASRRLDPSPARHAAPCAQSHVRIAPPPALCRLDLHTEIPCLPALHILKSTTGQMSQIFRLVPHLAITTETLVSSGKFRLCQPSLPEFRQDVSPFHLESVR